MYYSYYLSWTHFTVTIARAIELKHNASLIAALAFETANFYQKAGQYVDSLKEISEYEDYFPGAISFIFYIFSFCLQTTHSTPWSQSVAASGGNTFS